MALSKEFILTLRQLNNIGSLTAFKIAEKISTDVSSLEQLFDILKAINIPKMPRSIKEIKPEDLESAYKTALSVIQKAADEGVGVICYYDPEYPEILRSCLNEKGEKNEKGGKKDPPMILYYRGDISVLKKPGIAVIGTREPTPHGEEAAGYFSAEFAKKGYNIVSGLAVGCDSAAHRGALSVGGKTTAFLANGLDWASIYPGENLQLAKDIVDNHGLLLSEYGIGESCKSYALVARDRLQAGLSKATIVIQTGIKGGTMHAVNATLQYKEPVKPLFVVGYRGPEDLNNEKTQGNKYLKEKKGALVLRSSNIDEAIAIIEEPTKIDSYRATFI